MNKLRIYGSQPYSTQHIDIEIKLPQPLVCSRYTKCLDLMQIFVILRIVSMNWDFATNSKSLIPIYMKTDIWYFKLRLFDLWPNLKNLSGGLN